MFPINRGIPMAWWWGHKKGPDKPAKLGLPIVWQESEAPSFGRDYFALEKRADGVRWGSCRWLCLVDPKLELRLKSRQAVSDSSRPGHLGLLRLQKLLTVSFLLWGVAMWLWQGCIAWLYDIPGWWYGVGFLGRLGLQFGVKFLFLCMVWPLPFWTVFQHNVQAEI